MPSDFTVIRDSEFGVAQVEGQTEAGVEFVDAWLGDQKMVVVDSGRIILPDTSIAGFIEAANGAGLVADD